MHWSRWWWLLIPVLGLVEWGAHAVYAARPPEADDWDAIAEVIREMRDDDQLVVVTPYWAEPHARRVLGDWAMPLRDVARPDDERYAHAIEIGILGAPSELPGWRVTSERQVDKFRLRQLENPSPSPTLVDLVDRLVPGQASASTLRSKKRQACEWTTRGRVENGALHGHPTFPKRRFECKGGGSWHFVGTTVIEDQNYRPRRCVWAHPPGGGKTVVTFHDVKLGSKIVGYGGLPYFLERESKGTPVRLEVFVGDRRLGELIHDDGQGWRRFELSTQPLAGESHDVEFRVSSRKAHQREFCFQADIR